MQTDNFSFEHNLAMFFSSHASNLPFSFGSVSALANSSENATPPQSSMTSIMLSSMLAGMLSRVPCHPIDTAKAQMQASNSPFGLRTAIIQTYRHNGIRGLYAGFGAAFLGSAPASCLYFTTYEASKRALSSMAPNYAFTDSTSGLIAETVSCLLWVPIDVVKERLQVQRLAGDNYAGKYNGNIDAVKQIYRTEGLRGVYRGYGATIASYGPFSAIYLSTYEKLKVYLVGKLGEGMPAYFIAGGVAGGLASWYVDHVFT